MNGREWLQRSRQLSLNWRQSNQTPLNSAEVSIMYCTIVEVCMWVCVDGEGVSLGRGEVERCVEDLREKAQQLLEAQHLLSYLNHLQHIMKLWFAKYRGKN